MIIWKGWGILVALIGFGSLVVTEGVVESATQDTTFYQTHGWVQALAITIAAALVYLLARRLDRQPGRVLLDPSTGQDVILKTNHSLFFVPVRFWPYIFIGVGVLMLFSQR
jgi:nitrate reductase gamma subunit